jgi:hypothetical protein
MADLPMKPPNPVRLLAEIRGDSIRTARRLFESGQVPGAYQTKHGRWRIQKRPAHEVEAIIKWNCARLLHALKHRLFPRLDDVIELTLVLADVTNDDIAAVMNPNPIVRKHNIRALKKRAPKIWKLLCRPVDLSNFKELSQRVAEPHVQLLTKAKILRLHGYPVTRGNLAAIQNMPRSTFDRRYERERELIRRICGGSGHGALPELFRYQMNRQKIY